MNSTEGKKNSNAAFFIHTTCSRRWAKYDGQGIADLTKLGIKNFKQSFLSLCYKKVTKCYSRRRQLENSNVEFSRSFNVKVSAEVGTGRYCLWGASYQEIVYCMVLNPKFTNQGLSSKRFKLLNVTPVQIKPTLFANDR